MYLQVRYFGAFSAWRPYGAGKNTLMKNWTMVKIQPPATRYVEICSLLNEPRPKRLRMLSWIMITDVFAPV
jgi:hypothetical protein